MKASKDWGLCNCECGEHIKSGDEMVNIEGSLYLAGHESNRRTRFIETIKKEAPRAVVQEKLDIE